MKVYLVWECYQPLNKPFKKILIKIFLDFDKAMEFTDKLQTPDDWRECEQREAE